MKNLESLPEESVSLDVELNKKIERVGEVCADLAGLTEQSSLEVEKVHNAMQEADKLLHDVSMEIDNYRRTGDDHKNPYIFAEHSFNPDGTVESLYKKHLQLLSGIKQDIFDKLANQLLRDNYEPTAIEAAFFRGLMKYCQLAANRDESNGDITVRSEKYREVLQKFPELFENSGMVEV